MGVSYTVTITNGTGSGSYEVAAEASITANDAPEGQEFSHWSGNNQHLDDSTAATATLTVPAMDVTLTAVYKDEVNIPAAKESNVRLYPNPANNRVYISSGAIITGLQIIDITGNTVMQAKIESKDAQIDISQLPAGIYYISLNTNDGLNKFLKLIKQ